MSLIDIVFICVLVASFAALVSGPVRDNKRWAAIVTPLASIERALGAYRIDLKVL